MHRTSALPPAPNGGRTHETVEDSAAQCGTGREVLKEVMPLDRLRAITTAGLRTSICEELTDRLVITESGTSARMPVSSGTTAGKSYHVMLEKDIQPMSEYVSELKQVRFEEMLRHEEGRNDGWNGGRTG